jgi:probable rRNA maturation factor
VGFCALPFEDALVIFEKKIADLNEEMLSRFISRARKAAGLRGLVNVLVTSDAEMRQLNTRFRGKNTTTDVLSFPAESRAHGKIEFAGEIAISAPIAVQNAKRLGHSATLEIKVLVLHGILHLAGLDHERDNGEMARKEAKLRQALNLPVALTERRSGTGKGRRTA